MSTIATLNVALAATTNEFTNKMQAARGTITSVATTIVDDLGEKSLAFKALSWYFKAQQGGTGSIISLGYALASLAGPIAAVGAGFAAAGVATYKFTSWMGDLTSQAFTTLDALAKMSVRLQDTTENIVILNRIGGLNGIEDMSGALTKLNIVIGNAQSGSKEAVETFSRLGLSFDRLGKLNSVDRLKAVAEAMKDVESQSEKTRLASQLFGKSAGPELLVLLDQGAEGIQKQAEETKALGLLISNTDASKIEEANDALDDLSAVFASIGTAIAVEVAPYITSFTTGLLDVVKSVGGVRNAVETVVSAFTQFVSIVVRLTPYLNLIPPAFQAISYIASSLASTIYEVAATLGYLLGTQEQLSEATNRYQRATEKVNTVDVERIKTGADLVASMEEQLATYGMSANQIKIYKAGVEGANLADINRAIVINQQIEAMKKRDEAEKKSIEDRKKAQEKALADQKRAEEKARADAEKAEEDKRKKLENELEQWVEKSKTEYEKIEEEIKRVNELAGQGLLSQEVVDGLIAKFEEQLNSLDEKNKPKDKKEKKKAEGDQLVGAATRGSREAFSAIANNPVAKDTNTIAKEAVKQTTYLAKIATKQAELQVVTF